MSPPAPPVVVLCEPADPRNVGACVRAVANFGLAGVRVVGAALPDTEDLFAYSSYAAAQVPVSLHPSLASAVADCRLVIGTSRRPRRVDRPQACLAHELPGRLQGIDPVALVFGTERTGLTVAELDRCDLLVEIPTHTAFPSMNLGHAVACVGYELNRPPEAPLPAPPPTLPAACAGARDGFYDHVLSVVSELGYPPGRTPRAFVRRLRKLLGRANPNPDELSLVAGVFSELRRLGRMASR